MKRSYPSFSEAIAEAERRNRRERRVDPVLRAEVAALRAELAADRARLRADMTAAMYGVHRPARPPARPAVRPRATRPRAPEPGLVPTVPGARWFP